MSSKLNFHRHQHTLLVLFFSFFLTPCFGQNIFGNEWIKKNQKYIKIRISEDGVYRISYNQLQSSGLLANNPNPKNLQIFYRGQEIPIHVEGEGDDKFDVSDFIEFYGRKNDGELDKILYSPTSLQPNPEVSLFTDESVYFLTVSDATGGKRYQTLSVNTTSATEPFMSYTSSVNFAEAYYPGKYIIEAMSLSEYIEGEGYLGNLVAIGGTQNKSINTPNAISNSSFLPLLEYFVAGRSDASSTNINGYNHHLRLSLNNTTVKDTLYKAYATIRSSITVNSALPTTSVVTFSAINDLGANTDFQAPGYARITYPRSFEASNFSFLTFKIKSVNTNCLLDFSNTNWNDSYILEPESGKRYAGSKTSTNVQFKINNPQEKQLVVYDRTALKTPLLENVQFNLIDASTYNAKLIIITNSKLKESATEYAQYKISKGYTTLLLNTDEIYDQFYYGIHHPLAIKNLASFLLKKATNKPEYLFLLGKGYETPKTNLQEDLVPTMGYPASDSFFTSEIIDNNLAPALATGRVPAKTNEEVRIYLEKLKLYDNQPNAIWRKNIINISGGKNSGEDVSFSNYLNSFSNIASKEYFGAKTISFYKSVTDPITDNLMAKISEQINNGVSLLSFLGHGSTTGTAVSIGNPAFLSNKDKLLFYLINGCSTGNAFTSGSLGEDYIFQPQKGAIGWIGTSSEGMASYLSNFTSLFYQNSFNTNYGASISKNMLLSTRTYQNGIDVFNRAHTRQYIFLGDPTVGFYSPSQPDYEVKSEYIGVNGSNISASSPSIPLFVIVKNIGKSTANTIPIAIKRTLPDNSVINYPIKTYAKILNTDTLYIGIDNDIDNAAGNNKFTVTIDPANTISELSKLNNSADFSYFIQSNGVNILSPINYSIVANNNVELKVQSSDLFQKNINYSFEIDTLSDFSSNWKKSSGNINTGIIASWKPNAIFESNKVYYWRAKINDANQQNSSWNNGSFTVITDSPEGWSQAHYQQYNKAALKEVVFNQTTKQFDFTSTAYPIFARTKGQDNTTSAERRIRVSVSVGSLAFNSADFDGISIAAFNPANSSFLYNYPSAFNFKNDNVNGTGQFFFNTNNSVEVDSLVRYISQIPQGYYVVGISGRNFAPKTLPNNAKEALSSLGLSSFLNLEVGEPYIFYSKKVTNFTGAVEKMADYGSSTPARQQILEYSFDLQNLWSEGSITSEKIGPASKWTEASFNLKTQTNDAVLYSVIGINQNGQENLLKNNLPTSTINLSDISAADFPFLKLKLYAKDEIDKTIPQLKNWKVLYDGYPDVSFNPSNTSTFYSETIQEGDSIRIKVDLSNLSKLSSDSLKVSYRLTKSDRTTTVGAIKTTKPLLKEETETISFSFPTVGLRDLNLLQLRAEPKDGRDINMLNNYLSYSFNVKKDGKEPLIDVFFDNKRIINGEVVSPNPKISISIKDENNFLLLTDTTNVELYLKKEEDQVYKRIAFSDNKVSIQNIGTTSNNKIDFLYSPNTLADGRYSLKLRGKDVSGNYNTSNDYLVDFEVINEQTITNFLPYPNPFTTSMKFVFQVTGKVPDKIKVQIMTVTGKIVREVFKNELGTINIGNNISDFTWDGTDQFGDRLANGVYFYNVILENNDKSEIKHRSNTTDAFFKKNFGKIYLMR